MKRFSITFRNGDFRNLNMTRDELLADLRYMRSKWPEINCVIRFYIDGHVVNSKNISL